MLIKKTRSLCPTCNSIVNFEIVEEDDKIWLKRTCPSYGIFRQPYWSDAHIYHRFNDYDAVGNGIANPQNPGAPANRCSTAGGLCNNPYSQTLLANIDLTNRCNLNCDFCFANARVCRFVYEPIFDNPRNSQVLGRRG